MTFNYNKATQQCDLINTTGGVDTLNPVYTTGPQMCGVMTGLAIKYVQTLLYNSKSKYVQLETFKKCVI